MKVKQTKEEVFEGVRLAVYMAVVAVAMTLVPVIKADALDYLPDDNKTGELAMRCALLPGWGQMERGEEQKGLVMAAAFGTSAVMFMNSTKEYADMKLAYSQKNKGSVLTFKPEEDAFNSMLMWGTVGALVYVVSMVDIFAGHDVQLGAGSEGGTVELSW